VKKSLIIIAIVALLVVGGGSFYGGTLYGKSQNTGQPFAPGNFQKTGVGRQVGAGNGTAIISGDIISKDNNSITLELPNDKGSKIIFYSSTTQINKMATSTVDDLTNGTSVSITGTTNSDGSITAKSIQIRPVGQNLGGVNR
jgi:hypothetical protein